MIVSQAFSLGRKILNDFFEIEILLSHAINKSREFITAHPEFKINNAKAGLFKNFLLERKKGVPIPYLTHEKEFYGIKLHVDKRCLIPRPETELLVDLVLERVKPGDRILDIGTGSGAIVIALAKNFADPKIFACDISKRALETAKINIKKHKLTSKIKFFKSDLIPVKLKSQYFDIIVANLPYVEEKIKTFEPKIALYGGLFLYEKLFRQILHLKQKPKFLICELGYNQKRRFEKLLKKYFSGLKAEFFRDLAGIHRAFVLRF